MKSTIKEALESHWRHLDLKAELASMTFSDVATSRLGSNKSNLTLKRQGED